MVSQDYGLPDPPDSDDSLTTNTEIVIMNDSESDDDLNEYNGYEPLPLEIEEHESNMNDDDDDDAEEDELETPTSALPPITTIGESLLQELWSRSAPQAVDIKMDKEREDEVKQAMLSITLPPSSIPEWANSVPEEEWKDHLMQRLNFIKRNE